MDQKNIFELSDNSRYTTSSYAEITLYLTFSPVNEGGFATSDYVIYRCTICSFRSGHHFRSNCDTRGSRT